jgi:hypothetical protein
MSVKRVLDFLAYLAVALCVIAGFLVWMQYGSAWAARSTIDSKWLRVAFFSVFSFGALIRYRKPYWHVSRFWLLWALCVIIHVIVCVLVFRSVQVSQVAMFVVIVIDGLIFDTLIRTAIGTHP